MSTKNIMRTLAVLFLMATVLPKASATVVNWSYNQSDSTYCIMNISGASADLAASGNPYTLQMPQHIVPGQTMAAHFQARCSRNDSNAYILTAAARGPVGYQSDSVTLYCNTRNYTPDTTFNIYDGCTHIDFAYSANGNVTRKYYKLWIPMPVHLDVSDQTFTDSVLMGRSRDYYISLNSFLTWQDYRNIVITPVSDPATDSADFVIMRDTITPSARCGYAMNNQGGYQGGGYYNNWWFTNTNDFYNQFVIRFTPTATGVRTAKFVISNGRGNEDTITVTAKCYAPTINFSAATTGGSVKLIHNNYDTLLVSPYAFTYGDTIKLIAVPDSGYHFVYWNRDRRFRFDTLEFIARMGGSYYAYFEQDAPATPTVLNVSARSANNRYGYVRISGNNNGNGWGNGWGNNSNGYQAGDTLQVEAIANGGCIFMGWSDGTYAADYTLVLSQDTNLVAYFARANDVFSFEAEQDSATVQFASNNANAPVALRYTTDDGSTWNLFAANTTETIAQRGERLYVKAETTNPAFGSILADGSVEGYHFLTDSVTVRGNILYLLDNSGYVSSLPDTAFPGLFAGSDIVNANRLSLPTVTSMACYYSMFSNCDALQNTPTLSARQLADYCYANMFQGCSELTTAPTLPARQLVNHCYSGMFKNCVSLNEIDVAFDDWYETDSATFDWVNNVDTMGRFYSRYPLTQISDSSHIPFNWIGDAVLLTYGSSNFFWGQVTAVDATTGAPIVSGSLVNRGTDVIITAIPDSGYVFVRWDDGSNLRNNTIQQNDTIQVNANTSLTAIFEPASGNHGGYGNHGGFGPGRHGGFGPGFGGRGGHFWRAPEQDNGTDVQEVIVYSEGTSIIIFGVDNADVTIYDATGRIVTKVENATDPIDVNVPGVYFVQVNDLPAERILIK